MEPQTNNPVVALIYHGMAKRGMDRKSLGNALSSGGNNAKAFRKLDELLSGTRVAEEFAMRVCNALQIPDEQFAVAWEAHLDQVMAWRVESRRQAAEEMMKRRGPHLWGILPKGYYPSLITVIGPEFFLLLPVPDEVIQLPNFEMLQAVGNMAETHFREQRRCRLEGYEFRASMEEVYKFNTDGECLGRLEGLASSTRSCVRFGKNEIETTDGFLL
ncbi:MAG: hypothetical protein CMO55_20405 [Verrucomicrobiales bacterium]|nr:hypothetical protein [Verrucomicrobiales bacterium]